MMEKRKAPLCKGSCREATEGLFLCYFCVFHNPSASFLGTSPYTGEASFYVALS